MDPSELHARLFGSRPYSFALYSERAEMPILSVRSLGIPIFSTTFTEAIASVAQGHFPILVFRYDFMFDRVTAPEAAEALLWEPVDLRITEVEFAFMSREEVMNQFLFLTMAQGERRYHVEQEEADFAQFVAECHPGERLVQTWFARHPFPG